MEDRKLILKTEIKHLNKLQQRLNDWQSSIKEQIGNKTKELNSYGK